MKKMITLMVVLFFNSALASQDDDSIYGTHSITFQPVQRGGNLQGCTLVYLAVQADHVYLGGEPIGVIGNIGLHQYGFNLGLGMKIGVINNMTKRVIMRPNFAYLQTKSYSTAKVKQQSHEGDEGYRLYYYSLFDESVMKLFNEMIDTKKVTIAFNRKKGGMDLLVPVELDVVDVEYPEGDKVVRKRSNQALDDFTKCFLTLTEQAKRILEKKGGATKN
jgi:hypothetical protein